MVTDLRALHDRSTGETLWIWEPPALRGGTFVRYDTLTSPAADDFELAATCIDSDGTDNTTLHVDSPGPGDVLYFLVRAVNDCGDGSAGNASSGAPRATAGCL